MICYADHLGGLHSRQEGSSESGPPRVHLRHRKLIELSPHQDLAAGTCPSCRSH